MPKDEEWIEKTKEKIKSLQKDIVEAKVYQSREIYYYAVAGLIVASLILGGIYGYNSIPSEPPETALLNIYGFHVFGSDIYLCIFFIGFIIILPLIITFTYFSSFNDVDYLERKMRNYETLLRILETQEIYDKGFDDYVACRNFDPGTEDDFEVKRYREGWSDGKKEVEVKTPRNCSDKQITDMISSNKLSYELKRLPESLVIVNNLDLISYLLEEPSKLEALIDISVRIANLVPNYFPDAKVYLSVNDDPECIDRFLKFVIRQADYSDNFMETVEEMRKEYYEDVEKNGIWVLVTTDFVPLDGDNEVKI